MVLMLYVLQGRSYSMSINQRCAEKMKKKNFVVAWIVVFSIAKMSGGHPGGGTPLYGLYRYVPRNRVWFLEVLDA